MGNERLLLGNQRLLLGILGVSGFFGFSFFVWAAANGGVTNGGLRGVWPPFPEISRNRPFSPFFCLFRLFLEGPKSTWKIQKTEENGLFPQISSDLLKPPSLKPPFAALQFVAGGFSDSVGRGGARRGFRKYLSHIGSTCSRRPTKTR